MCFCDVGREVGILGDKWTIESFFYYHTHIIGCQDLFFHSHAHYRLNNGRMNEFFMNYAHSIGHLSTIYCFYAHFKKNSWAYG